MEKLPFLILLVIGAGLALAGWRSLMLGRLARRGDLRFMEEGLGGLTIGALLIVVTLVLWLH